MSPIAFCCPKGHKVTAKPELAGKLVKCPSCKSVMMVPERPLTLPSPRNELTQSGVLRILGEAPRLPPIPEKPTHTKRSCPRCRKSIAPSLTICSNCQLYVGLNIVTSDRFRQLEMEN